MADKRFIVLGLGTFGAALASRLFENDCRVTGVDRDRDRVEELKGVLYEAVIGDTTSREVLEQLSIKTADAVFIGLGEDIARSLLATLHCKELGAKRIIVKGVTPEHGKLLQHLGVERVVFPENEVAQELADRMTWPNVLDYLPIDREHSIVEFAVPTELEGKTLAEADLRRRLGIMVVGLKDVLTGKFELFPGGDMRLHDGQLLLVVGKQEDLARLRKLG